MLTVREIGLEISSPVRTALRLEIVTIIWMVGEAAAALGAGIAADGLLLVAFGIDSCIELTWAIIVFRRFRIEIFLENREGVRAVERKTTRIAGRLLLLLAIYVLVQATFGLATRHAAEASPLGIGIAVIAAFGMPVLAKAKLRLADKTDSRSLRADAMETFTCGYLSWILLAGLALNAQARWWWIDSVAALALVPLLIKEGREAIRGGSACCGNE